MEGGRKEERVRERESGQREREGEGVRFGAEQTRED